MLVDSRGNPLSASDSGSSGPMYGPVRFEDQSAKVRRLGRKQLAGLTKSQRIRKTAWRSRQWKKSGLGHLMAEVEVPRWATKSAEARRSKRRGSGRKRRASSGWGYAAARGSYRTSSRRKRRSVGARRSKRGLSRKELRKQNRAAWRAQQSSRKARRSGGSRRTKSRGTRSRRATRTSARRTRTSARRSTARRGGSKRSRRVTYGQIMSQLRGTRTKAWVCAGPKRTGCGGGRKGRRGSRVLGILRG